MADCPCEGASCRLYSLPLQPAFGLRSQAISSPNRAAILNRRHLSLGNDADPALDPVLDPVRVGPGSAADRVRRCCAVLGHVHQAELAPKHRRKTLRGSVSSAEAQRS